VPSERRSILRLIFQPAAVVRTNSHRLGAGRGESEIPFVPPVVRHLVGLGGSDAA